MDVPLLLVGAGPQATREQALQQQAAVYHDLVAACAAVSGCRSVTFWGVTDAHTWLSRYFGTRGEPLLFDAEYRRKPAYRGVASALLGEE